MKWSRVRALAVKDVEAVLNGGPGVLLPMIIVPVVFCVVLPAAIYLLTHFGMENLIQGEELVKQVVGYYPVPDAVHGDSLRMAYVFLNYTFLPLFMLVPIMTASILSANAVVGEKERGTLETLLYSPLTNEEFLTAKLLGAFIPGIVVGYLGFVGYFTVANLLSWFLDGIVVVSAPIWWPAMLLLTPSVALSGLTATLMVSLRAKTFVEAQQVAGIVVLPFIILVITQVTGVVVFVPWMVIAFSVVLLAICALLLYRIGPEFSREAIITTI